jgi:ribonuclease P/MRP protein subunit POP5
MSPRPPSMRDKRRYLLVQVLPRCLIPEQKDLYLAVQDAVTSVWGDATSARIQAAVVAGGQGYGIIRCLRGTETQLATAVSTVTTISGQRACIRPCAVSGTIAALQRRGIPSPCPPGPVDAGVVFDGRTFTIRCRDGEKVDLLEKGFKTQEQLFLTRQEVEEI